MIVSSTEPKLFHHLGKLTTAPEQWGVDFFWIAKRPDSPVERWGVQRKEINDLLASINDGRFNKEVAQMRALDQAVLIVEGQWTYHSNGKMKLPGKHGSKNRWTFSSLHSFFMSVQNQGIWVLFARDKDETIELLIGAEAWSRKEHSTFGSRGGAQPVNMWGKSANTDYQAWLLQGLPGVGEKTAVDIIKHFDGVPFRMACTAEELMEVKGIGKKSAQKIIDTIEGAGTQVPGSRS